MNTSVFIKQASMGGPGLDGYAYRADICCVECGRAIIREIALEIAPKLINIDDPLFRDSETVPQPIFFGESDCAEHCAKCGAYLYGTPDTKALTDTLGRVRDYLFDDESATARRLRREIDTIIGQR